MQTSSRIAGLDLLRGFAIALVLLRHAFPNVLGGAGIVGVVVFFTLSGYLISGILLAGIKRQGTVEYRRFYRNRALRLIPALAVMLLVFAVVELATNRLDDRHLVASSVLIAIFYLTDLPLGVPFSVGIAHLWTLAVEEQFYLFWPLVLIAATRLRRTAGVIAAAAVLLWLICAGSIIVFPDHVGRLYTLPTSWAITLAIGALAFLYRDRLYAFSRSRAGRVAAALSVVLLLLMCLAPESKDRPVAYLVGGPLVAVCTVALVGVLGTWREVPHQAFLPLLALGTVSYAAYLWNFLIVNWLLPPHVQQGGLGSSGRALLSIPLTIAAATGSWFLVERPVHRWKVARDAGQEEKLLQLQASRAD